MGLGGGTAGGFIGSEDKSAAIICEGEGTGRVEVEGAVAEIGELVAATVETCVIG